MISCNVSRDTRCLVRLWTQDVVASSLQTGIAQLEEVGSFPDMVTHPASYIVCRLLRKTPLNRPKVQPLPAHEVPIVVYLSLVELAGVMNSPHNWGCRAGHLLESYIGGADDLGDCREPRTWRMSLPVRQRASLRRRVATALSVQLWYSGLHAGAFSPRLSATVPWSCCRL
jgi:hypothetical protein